MLKGKKGDAIQEGARWQPGKQGVPYISFPAFEPYQKLRHGYSTRLGGVSTGQCAEMSFSVKCGDTIEQIRENFRRMTEAIGVRASGIAGTCMRRKPTDYTTSSRRNRDKRTGNHIGLFYGRLCAVVFLRSGQTGDWSFSCRLAWNGTGNREKNRADDEGSVWNGCI